MSENLEQSELAKFDRLGDKWWDVDGEMGPLHALNPLRLDYIIQRAPLQGVDAADIGCGGGILSEAMAQAGATVTGVDMAGEAIAAARRHAESSGLSIDYRHLSVDALARESAGAYDVVTCMEMLEHVPSPADIIRHCANLLKPGGHLFLSTLNRNPKSFLMAIVGAEYLMNLLPRGTHDYAKFIRPSELADWCRQASLEVKDVSGLHYDPIFRQHHVGGKPDVNYLLHAVKPAA